MSLRDNIKIAISTYPNDIYKSILEDWRLLEFTSNTHKGLATEHLYMNYPEPSELHDYSYLGDNYRDRENIKRRHSTLLKKIDRLSPLEKLKLYDKLNLKRC